ncbi:putative ribonuclease H-like domain-containing protein [Tanacetum coccineum]
MPWLLKMELVGMTGATKIRKSILQTCIEGYNFHGVVLSSSDYAITKVKSENIDVITVVTPSNVKKIESNHEFVDVKNNGDAVEPKTVRKNSFRPPVIEDWNSDDESEGNPQQKEYKEKGVIDSGCSRHMTGNKCYLSEYEDFNGGFISFGDGKGRISRKGKIKTGTLDFDNVFFLATKDEISGILNTFITKIENQLDYKVKFIRSDNGTEFKNSVMNQFCKMKGIRREFSVARTPRQNGVAERKNRTLIEAARTMLVDSKLPTTFWAEAVNIACYVLNRVLIIKPHTKTPYELIHGRTPLIDFIKPFGCPITILNTKDHIGMFDGKVDEGFFVGYSVVSKAMRVFNKRTRIVEETLNIRFLENAPNVIGNRPDWIFDVDSLTISMNFVPVIAGNQTNGITRTRDNIVIGQAEKKTKHEQEYILIPFCTTDPLISQGPKDSEEDSGMKPIEVDVSVASDKDGEDDQAIRSEFERLFQQEKQTNSTNSFNIVGTPVSAAGPSFTYDDPSSPFNVAEASNAFEEHLFERFSPFKNAFTLPTVSNVTPIDDTGIFGNAYDDEDMGAKADLDNLETTISRAIGTKWVFKNKKDKRGIVIRNKARLVAQGFEDPQFPDKVDKVEKALCGLHQAPKAWYETLSTYLIENGFRRGTIDKTLFIKKDKASTPMEPNKALVKDEEADSVDVHLYRSMIGSLMYLTASRPDIIYLKGQPKLGLWYPRDSPFDLKAFSYSDYAGAILDRKSTTGGCQFLGKRLISWQCKKQTIVANSTTEAEYVAAANCCG